MYKGSVNILIYCIITLLLHCVYMYMCTASYRITKCVYTIIYDKYWALKIKVSKDFQARVYVYSRSLSRDPITRPRNKPDLYPIHTRPIVASLNLWSRIVREYLRAASRGSHNGVRSRHPRPTGSRSSHPSRPNRMIYRVWNAPKRHLRVRPNATSSR